MSGDPRRHWRRLLEAFDDGSRSAPVRVSSRSGMMLTAPLRGLAVGLTAALLAVGLPTLHEHGSTEPALYDDECPLVQFGAHAIGIGLPRAVDLVSPLSPVEDALHSPGPSSFEASLAASEPRAPPITG